MANAVNWSLKNNAIPTDNSTLIADQRLTTLTPSNPRGYESLGLTDNSVKNLNYSIQTDGKITYAFVDQNGNVGRQFNNMKEVSDYLSGGIGRNVPTNTIKKIQNSLQQQLTNKTNTTIINSGPQSPFSQAPGGPNNQSTNPQSTNINFTISASQDRSSSPGGFGSYSYPTDLGKNKQDFIQFTIYEYQPKKLTSLGNNSNLATFQQRQLKKPVGTISLPIQPSISDTNNVDWNGLTVNPLEMELAGTSLTLMNGQNSDIIERIKKAFDGNGNVTKAVELYLAQQAAGTKGLLSRVGGAIINPNMELLFQGPTLRPFTFNFRLSPRDSDEAKSVKSIIRVFKEAMAVKTAPQNLFLTTPNIFEIKYVLGNTGANFTTHPSLNKIKTCALKSCNVDYTPDGSYMTFKDPNATMTSYGLTLQFQELEPVTTQDYKDDQGNFLQEDHIGY